MTAAKKTAAKPTTTEEETKVSPIKRSTRTVLSLEVEGTEYTGDIEVSEETLTELDEIAAEWDKAKAAYEELTSKLVFKLDEMGLKPAVTKKAASNAKLIRRWARRVNIDVNAQGQIPQDVRDKYESAKAKGELQADEQ
jgi:hypothetical protein